MTLNRTDRLQYEEFKNDYVEPEDRLILNFGIIIFMAIIGLISFILYLSFPSKPDVFHDESPEALTSTGKNVGDHLQTLRQTLTLRKMELRISELDEELNTLCRIAKTLNMYNTVIKHKCNK